MNVRMTARHFDLSARIKGHVQERSDHFERFFDNIVDVHWLLNVENRRHTAEVSAKVFGAQLVGRAEAGDIRSAVDEAANKMEAQLKKHKGRLKDKDPKAIAAAKAAAAESLEGTAAGDDEDEF